MRLLAALTLIAAACGGPPPLPPLPEVGGRPRPVEEARALVASLRAREDALAGWKAVHALEVDDRAGGRRAKLRGVLLVRRPDRFRLRLVGPAGLTAMDLVYVAPRYRLEVPGRPVVRGADASREKRLPVAAMARAFLRDFTGEPRALRAASGRKRIDFAHRTLLVGGGDDVLVDSFREGGDETLRVTYADYRDVSGRRLPMRVRMDLPARDLTARVTVERYEIGGVIPDAAFEMPQR